MKIKDYKCKCGHNDFFFADKGNQKGIYCSYCGKWVKWADKDEQNLTMKQEPCEDAVSRQAAIDAFERFIHELGIKDEPYNYGEMALSVKNVPPVIPKPKTGHWIPTVVRGQNSFCCSECLSECCYTPTAFCPNCGCEIAESEEK